MNIITDDDVLNLFRRRTGPQNHPWRITIAYIQSLLRTVNLAGLETRDNIIDWINRTFPRDLADRFVEELRMGGPHYDNRNTIETVKQNVILRLGAYIIEGAKDTLRETGDEFNVLPWDVLDYISSDTQLSTLFNIEETDENSTLPVTITIGEDQATHELTEDVAMGLFLFYDNLGDDRDDHDFHITMFNSELPHHLNPLLPGEDRREFDPETVAFDRYLFDKYHDGISTHKYSFTVNNVLYGFHTYEFVQGFITGAMWLGVDHHDYWSGLTEHNDDNTITNLTF